jgi:flagellar biosynthetic protein FlhB
MAKKRMMAEVPKADVVITNPTHYAVAIRYDKTKDEAPRVVAKGVDNLALKIKEIAREAGVMIVENPPLARELYKSVDVDEVIPPKLYKAVAEVLAFVYRSKGMT